MMWRRDEAPQRTQVQVVDDPLAIECEAFLRGRYIEHLERDASPIPSWAWINQAAHATVVELEVSAARLGGTPWEMVQSNLARAVLGAVHGVDLADVQRRDLVPLELALMHEEATPRRIVELTCQALYGR